MLDKNEILPNEIRLERNKFTLGLADLTVDNCYEVDEVAKSKVCVHFECNEITTVL